LFIKISCIFTNQLSISFIILNIYLLYSIIFQDTALTDPEIGKFFVPEKIEEYRGFGGVRIEDDIIITKDGCEVMSIVPRTVEDIEMWMAGHDVKLK